MELSLLLKRREEREVLFLLLFENDFNNYSLDSIIENKKEFDDSFEVTDFIREVFCGVKNHQDYMDDLISRHSLKWGKNRISKVSITILRIATYEILFKNDIPDNVSINEAVELAKKYGVESEFSFINGILGSLCKEKNND